MNFNKMLKKVNMTHLVILVGALILGYALFNYSMQKSSVGESMAAKVASSMAIPEHIANPPTAPGQDAPTGVCAGNPQPSAPIGENSGPASAQGINSSMQGLPPSCARQQVVNPEELLPKDESSEWAKLNPMGAGDLQNVNLLKAGHLIGINTVSSSLRNANLQLRSEPANPQTVVTPFFQSTIAPDINRRPLEIGCDGNQM